MVCRCKQCFCNEKRTPEHNTCTVTVTTDADSAGSVTGATPTLGAFTKTEEIKGRTDTFYYSALPAVIQSTQAIRLVVVIISYYFIITSLKH